MSNPHAVSQHYKAHLLSAEAATDAHLRALHARAIANLRPHIDTFMHELEAKRATLDEDEKFPLSWLYEHDRLHKITRLIADELNRYGKQAELATVQAVHDAKGLGEVSAHAQMQASVPRGVTWAFKRAKEGKG